MHLHLIYKSSFLISIGFFLCILQQVHDNPHCFTTNPDVLHQGGGNRCNDRYSVPAYRTFLAYLNLNCSLYSGQQRGRSAAKD